VPYFTQHGASQYKENQRNRIFLIVEF
jgi:hypothetical protein